MVREVVLEGLGIGFCEAMSVTAHIRDKKLVRVLPDYALRGGGLWAIYPSTHHLSPKVRVFVDFLSAQMREVGGLDR